MTDNFLFVPGLLLVLREELDEIKIVENYFSFRVRDLLFGILPLFPLPELNRKKGGFFNIKTVTSFEFVSKGVSLRFPLDYSYRKSPETAEQVMAWYWQCDTKTPGLSERVAGLITKYYL